jgi:hypothetical protein
VIANYSGSFTFEARGEDLSKGNEIKSRFKDLWGEAQNSIEEYRLKYLSSD